MVFSMRVGIDNLSNQGTKPEEISKYGYGRLDAIGRIYNRVLITVLRKEDIQDALQGITYFASDDQPKSGGLLGRSLHIAR